MSDEEILKNSYKKPALFGQLFDRYNKQFLRTARKTLRSGDDAEDVVQETFVRIYKYGKKFGEKDGAKFKSWANAILRNCLADQINKYRNASASLTEEVEDLSPEASQAAVFENGSYTQFVLSKIDGATADIINLRYVLGKSFKEIGKILGIKSGTARVRAHRSKKVFIETYNQYNTYE